MIKNKELSKGVCGVLANIVSTEKEYETAIEMCLGASLQNIVTDTEEDAKKVAIEKLNQIGFNSNIIGTNHYKEIDSTKIMYRFDTKDNYEITIDGQTGEFYQKTDGRRAEFKKSICPARFF